MKQSYSLLLVTLILCGVWHQAVADSAAGKYREGLQYQRIDPPAPLDEIQGRVEVVEMFLYACPHCYELEPKLRQWLNDKPYIEFHRMPAIMGPSWADQARAFYMIEALGNPDQMHEELFKAIQEDGLQINNEYSVVEFFTSQGVDRQEALGLYRSPEIMASVNQARIKTVKYGLRGVPAMIVNGKFKTAPFFVRNQEEMLEVLDALVEKERMPSKAANKAEK
jgi:thiol:disulfide interchange protein DsbA